jgi:hypothetical protein
MLNIDNIREIAYQADYETTKKTLKLYPELDDDQFWKSKCLKLFPRETYLDFYTGEENYLIRERGVFALAVDFSGNGNCENLLFEHFDMLDKILDLSSEKIYDGMGYMLEILIKLIVKNRFIVIKNLEGFFVEQCSTELDAIDIMMNDAITYKNNEYAEYINYMIIDLKSITPYFWKIGSLTKKQKAAFKFYDINKLDI